MEDYNIYFYNEYEEDYQIPYEEALTQYIHQLIEDEGPWENFELRYILMTDDALLEINKEFLQHDYYTDIITFDLSELPSVLDSDIYISIDRIKDNAEELNIPFEEEYLRVVFHGLLHLFGFDDESEEDIKEMRAEENFLIKDFKSLLNEN